MDWVTYGISELSAGNLRIVVIKLVVTDVPPGSVLIYQERTHTRRAVNTNCKKRMHSSRMRTVRCSGRLTCYARPLPRMLPTMHAPQCMPPPCMPPVMHTNPPTPIMHAPHHTCPPATHAPLPCTPPLPWTPPPVCPPRQNDRCLWKHNLYATTVADSKNSPQVCCYWTQSPDSRSWVLGKCFYESLASGFHRFWLSWLAKLITSKLHTKNEVNTISHVRLWFIYIKGQWLIWSINVNTCMLSV